jgi:hypothetical protein
MRSPLSLTLLHFAMRCASARVAIQKSVVSHGAGTMLSGLCPAAPDYIHACRYFPTFPKTNQLSALIHLEFKLHSISSVEARWRAQSRGWHRTASSDDGRQGQGR